MNHNHTLISFAFVLLFSACAAKKTGSASNKMSTDDRTIPVKQLTDNTYLLTEYATDANYGSVRNPVKVGGVKENQGPVNERKYLNALLGPHGETVKYFRSGSCCPFKTKNGFIDDTGLLDHYRVFYEGGRDTVSIYINMYDFGNLYIPVGFTARK